MDRNTAKRLALGVGLPLLGLLLLWSAWSGSFPPCIFLRITGWYCPGCGTVRAVRALLRGQVLTAFRWNPLLFFLGIPALAALAHWYLRRVFPGLGLRPVQIPRALLAGVVAAVLGYWVLRNLPGFAFLAPGGLS